MKLTPAQFVSAWQSSKTLQEASGKTGLSPRTCSQRASWYRSRGVRLKKFEPKKPDLDVKALNALASRAA